MSWEDRRTARRDGENTKYLTDSAHIDYRPNGDGTRHSVLVHADGREARLSVNDMISLVHYFREPDEAALEGAIEVLLTGAAHAD